LDALVDHDPQKILFGAELNTRLIDATSWEEFHGIAEAHGVDWTFARTVSFFTDLRNQIHVKASAIDRQLGKCRPSYRLRCSTDRAPADAASNQAACARGTTRTDKRD
jgi:hypothetical protein